jgi:hypothetical protein
LPSKSYKIFYDENKTPKPKNQKPKLFLFQKNLKGVIMMFFVVKLLLFLCSSLMLIVPIKTAPSGPNLSQFEQEKLSTGTTICGIVCSDGLVIGADSRR